MLGVLFIVVPIAELAVIIQVGQAIGVLPTIALLILVSVVGAWLVKREGLGVLRRVQQSLDRAQLPHRELIDGALVMLAGAFLLSPGFLTDLLGIVLLVPPTRAVVRTALLHRFRDRMVAGVRTTRFGRVVDVAGRDWPPPPPRRRPELP